MRYRCIIADDNILERDLLQLLLERTGLVEIIAVCNDGLEAYQVLNTRQTDIVFTDINMPHLNGLELVKSLKQQPVFVLISAHAMYAVDAFDLDVADFILKPVLMERLLRALDKATAFLELRRKETTDRQALPYLRGDYFFIRTSDGLVRIDHNTISHIEAAGNFSKIYTVQGHCHLTLVNLKSMIAQLPDSLIRVHRQYLVNVHKIDQIEAAAVKVAGVHVIPLSNQYRQALSNRVAAHVIQRHPG